MSGGVIRYSPEFGAGSPSKIGQASTVEMLNNKLLETGLSSDTFNTYTKIVGLSKNDDQSFDIFLHDQWSSGTHSLYKITVSYDLLTLDDVQQYWPIQCTQRWGWPLLTTVWQA